jgi:hypothetical protein
LKLEKKAFTLVRAWSHQSPSVTDKAQRLALFKQFAPLLRYHHMSLDFVANVVDGTGLISTSSPARRCCSVRA